MSADGAWDRVTYRLDPRFEGPEPQDIALKEFVHQRPVGPRVTSAELARTDEHGHWVDIWLDPDEPEWTCPGIDIAPRRNDD